ncbi:hypothetical protein [Pseudonocardia kunmingensis]|uniref:Uncharacterized protein n=1 Tax=Pseudonocardia kunmingensis TaxID=630975 RepID=A0A543DIW4_9PSEU|nr:hypothetical protein [Pseudonocardia kunmingensis]TQM09274.1 hypothetical protein FB558_5026 [Pseudonocardia kunmingensis]
MTHRSRLEVAIDDASGRLLATAAIDLADPVVARAALHIETCRVPPGIRARLVDAVLDVPEVAARPHLQVALPLGDTEILDRVRERCECIQTRAAGVTCLVEADIRPARPAGTGGRAGT